MTTLEYRFVNDILIKMLFVQYPHLLKRLVANILGIPLASITQFVITNTEIVPEHLGEKFCRLDINMNVNGQRVELEFQIANLGDYPDRSLYYWAREFSSALSEGMDYVMLPTTIVISILDFKLFDCKEYFSEFRPLEVTRHTLLTEKQRLLYFELPKLAELTDADIHDELKLWLMLFKAKTEEELKQIEKLEVPVMAEAINAYRLVSATDEFKELERLRSRARHNEAAALRHAAEVEREKWQVVVAEKDTAHAAELAEKDTALANQEALIKELMAKLAENK